MKKGEIDRLARTLGAGEIGVVRRLSAAYDGEDIYQDALLAMIEKTPATMELRSPEAWFRTIARNIALRRYRDEKVRKCETLQPDESEAQSNQRRGTDQLEVSEELANAEHQSIVMDEVRSLSPKYAQVLICYFQHEMSFAEIASELSEPIETIRTRYRRGLQQLKATPKISGLRN